MEYFHFSGNNLIKVYEVSRIDKFDSLVHTLTHTYNSLNNILIYYYTYRYTEYEYEHQQQWFFVVFDLIEKWEHNTSMGKLHKIFFLENISKSRTLIK